jgi:hypothetical protein
VVVLPTLDEQKRLSCLFALERIREVEPLAMGETFGFIPWPDSVEVRGWLVS